MDFSNPVVGIGASAGGLEALQRFVGAIAPDHPASFVIIQHLSPDHPSIMDRLLDDHSDVYVRQIEDSAQLSPAGVYVAPPGYFVELKAGRLKLVEHPREMGLRTPIDRFFQSLADHSGQQAFGVVLSGTGSDGTHGIRAIKSVGGTVLSQESMSAKFSGMPDNASATGLVDFEILPEKMPLRIRHIIEHQQNLADDGDREALMAQYQERLPDVLNLLEAGGKHSFQGYKPGTLVRRIMRRIALLRAGGLDDYMEILRADEAERDVLAQDFLIGVTEFFRDPECFEALAERALRPLIVQNPARLRIWCPGCSTGEEVYSLAMLLVEEMDAQGARVPVQLFGTDIDLQALRYARAGSYSQLALTGVSEARQDRFFVKNSGRWEVIPQLREICVFAPHNLLQDPPFSRLDVITCRNVMIYLKADSQQAVFPRFQYALNPGGHLMLGPSETISDGDALFKTVDRNTRLYARNNAAKPAYSALERRQTERVLRSMAAPTGVRAAASAVAAPEGSVYEQTFLREFASPFAVVEDDGTIAYLSDAMTQFVRPDRGAPRLTLDALLSEDLRGPSADAMAQARAKDGAAVVDNVVTQVDGAARLFDIHARVLGPSETMLALKDVRQRSVSVDGAPPIAPEQARVDQLQRELDLTRERLKRAQAEYQTADQDLHSNNEELFSMNEELQSSNEELETSREELQSINEELETFNAELTENNRQLNRSNSNLQNLLQSTNIATVFLDTSGCVRLFTPAAQELFRLQERDIGRPISDLSAKIDYPDLESDAKRAENELVAINREVHHLDTEQIFDVTIRPYRTTDNRLDGAVITFIDMTDVKSYIVDIQEAQRALAEQAEELQILYDSVPLGMYVYDRDLRYIRLNKAAADINGITIEDHLGKTHQEVVPGVHADVEQILRTVLETGEPCLNTSVKTTTPAHPDEMREFLVDYLPVKRDGSTFALATVVRDVTDYQNLSRALSETQARLNRLFDQAPAVITIFEGPEHRYIYANPPHKKLRAEDPIGKTLREVYPEIEGQKIFEQFDKVYETGEPAYLEEMQATIDTQLTPGRKTSYYRVVIQPWFDDQGKIGGVMAFNLDISEIVEAKLEATNARDRLQKVQDSLNSFVGLLELDGTLVEVNKLALEASGVAREAVIGQKIWDCPWYAQSATSQVRIADAVARAAKGERLEYEEQITLANGDVITVSLAVAPRRNEAGDITEIISSGVDITDRKRAEERKDILLAELQHRVKNILATVQAVARFTAQHADDLDTCMASLQQRLAAIGRTHDVLNQNNWAGQNLHALIKAEFAPFLPNKNDRLERLKLTGDDVELTASAALSVALALHEMVTNALKYGALSAERGSVSIDITARKTGDLERLVWRETGGPKTSAPKREGFGLFLINTVFGDELSADIDMRFAPEGLEMTLSQRTP